MYAKNAVLILINMNVDVNDLLEHKLKMATMKTPKLLYQ